MKRYLVGFFTLGLFVTSVLVRPLGVVADDPCVPMPPTTDLAKTACATGLKTKAQASLNQALAAPDTSPDLIKTKTIYLQSALDNYNKVVSFANGGAPALPYIDLSASSYTTTVNTPVQFLAVTHNGVSKQGCCVINYDVQGSMPSGQVARPGRAIANGFLHDDLTVSTDRPMTLLPQSYSYPAPGIYQVQIYNQNSGLRGSLASNSVCITVTDPNDPGAILNGTCPPAGNGPQQNLAPVTPVSSPVGANTNPPTISPAPPAPTVSFTSRFYRTGSNGANVYVFTWSSLNTDYCVGQNFGGAGVMPSNNGAVNTRYVYQPYTTTTYSLTCTKVSGGSVTAPPITLTGTSVVGQVETNNSGGYVGTYNAHATVASPTNVTTNTSASSGANNARALSASAPSLSLTFPADASFPSDDLHNPMIQAGSSLSIGGTPKQLVLAGAISAAWSTSNSAVATVNSTGLVTPGHTSGKATITATANGNRASVTVDVGNDCTGVYPGGKHDGWRLTNGAPNFICYDGKWYSQYGQDKWKWWDGVSPYAIPGPLPAAKGSWCLEANGLFQRDTVPSSCGLVGIKNLSSNQLASLLSALKTLLMGLQTQ